jgi:hypothetical protein
MGHLFNMMQNRLLVLEESVLIPAEHTMQCTIVAKQFPGPKYKKVSFSNPGHAINLAKKLNTQFRTNKFTVVLLRAGDQVYPTITGTASESQS